MVAVRTPDTVAKPRISDGPYRAGAWVRRSRVGSCQSFQRLPFARQTPWAALSDLPLFVPDHGAAVQSSSPCADVRSNATAAGSVSYRQDVNRNVAGWVDSRSSTGPPVGVGGLYFCPCDKAQAQMACRRLQALVC